MPINDRLSEQSLPLGEGAERSEADEGQYSTDCKKIFIVRLNFYPHQSQLKDFCQLPPGEAMGATAPVLI